ncbi:hypothetical protein U9M48_037988 [Paspalum notatum var. saurae]|uniref:Uncharacterized protein n=1 Tax=Paspalum notatum var. saurae TaxID=547442 RepID=A0AAQ3UGR0_PASNO
MELTSQNNLPILPHTLSDPASSSDLRAAAELPIRRALPLIWAALVSCRWRRCNCIGGVASIRIVGFPHGSSCSSRRLQQVPRSR